jgi:hypothetical protein
VRLRGRHRWPDSGGSHGALQDDARLKWALPD